MMDGGVAGRGSFVDPFGHMWLIGKILEVTLTR